MLALTTFAAQVRDSRTASQSGITRRIMIDERNVQAVRSTYQPGPAKPRGPHAFDVMIVPLNEGKLDVTIGGKSVEWKIGEAIFIARAVEHAIANNEKKPAELVPLRIP